MNRYITSILMIVGCLFSGQTFASKTLQAGEAYVTRFSGVSDVENTGDKTIDLNGTVGSIFDLRAPGVEPRWQHWFNEPQRNPIKAEDAGQVFGIAIDDDSRKTVYVTATSKFGLHRNEDNSDWMLGMWGKKAGPGTIYRLRARKGYQPEIFCDC